MGALLKALSPSSSHAAKQTDLWPDIMDRIDGALLPADLDEVERWLAAHELEIPGGWWEPIRDRIELTRKQLASEDINAILRDRFDF